MIRVILALIVALLAQAYPIWLAFEALWAAYGLMATVAICCIPAIGTMIILEILK